MKKLLSRLDRLMAAVTFAEANEPETALDFLADSGTGAGKKTQKTKAVEHEHQSDHHAVPKAI